MNRTNPSLKALQARMGSNRSVRTQNRIPIREAYQAAGVDWKEAYANWPQIEQKCLELQRWLNARSKIMIVVGSENHQSFDLLLDLEPKSGALEISKVKLNVPFRMFGEDPYLLLVREKSTKDIKQLVFFSFHSQYFYRPEAGMHFRAYHDLLWNAACEMAGIEVQTSNYFIKQAEAVRHSGRNSAVKQKATQMHLSFELRSHEKRSGIFLSEALVRRTFKKTLQKKYYAHRLVPFKGSWVGGIAKLFSEKGTETRQSLEWRQSSNFNQVYSTHQRNFADGQAKAQTTRETEEWKASEQAVSQKAHLHLGPKSWRNVIEPKIQALLNSFQARQLIAMDPNTTSMSSYQRDVRQTLTKLAGNELNRNQKKHFLRVHAVSEVQQPRKRLWMEKNTIN